MKRQRGFATLLVTLAVVAVMGLVSAVQAHHVAAHHCQPIAGQVTPFTTVYAPMPIHKVRQAYRCDGGQVVSYVITKE